MTIFYVFIALIIWLKMLEKSISKKHTVFIVSIALFVIFLLKDLSVGPDLLGYMKAYETWPYKYKETEPGYYAIVNISRFFGLSSYEFIILLYAFFIGSLGRFIYKYSKDVYISYIIVLSLGLIWNFMYILRQGIAACIIMFAVDFMVKKKPIKYVLLIFVAATFHISALLLLPFYWISYIKFNKIFVSVFAFFGVFILAFKNQLIALVLLILPKYENYLNFGENSLSLFVIIEAFVLTVVCVYFYSKTKPINNLLSTNKVFVKYIFMYDLVVIFASIKPVFLRMNLYFFAPVAILLPNVIENETNPNMKKLFKFGIVVVYILRFYITSRDNAYIFFWQ